MPDGMDAKAIVRALGGRWCGSYGTARCPGHDDHKPSLSITTGKDGKVLFRCHAGCDQDQVLDALKVRGLWEHRDRHAGQRRPYKLRQSTNKAPERDDTMRTEIALRIWQASAPTPGKLVEIYLDRAA